MFSFWVVRIFVNLTFCSGIFWGYICIASVKFVYHRKIHLTYQSSPVPNSFQWIHEKFNHICHLFMRKIISTKPEKLESGQPDYGCWCRNSCREDLLTCGFHWDVIRWIFSALSLSLSLSFSFLAAFLSWLHWQSGGRRPSVSHFFYTQYAKYQCWKNNNRIYIDGWVWKVLRERLTWSSSFDWF